MTTADFDIFNSKKDSMGKWAEAQTEVIEISSDEGEDDVTYVASYTLDNRYCSKSVNDFENEVIICDDDSVDDLPDLPSIKIEDEVLVYQGDGVDDLPDLPNIKIEDEVLVCKDEGVDGLPDLPNLKVTTDVQAKSLKRYIFEKPHLNHTGNYDHVDPPNKRTKIENRSKRTVCNEELLFSSKRNLCRKLSTGVVQGIINPCSRDSQRCYERHLKEETRWINMQTQVAFQTMMEDDNLYTHAMRVLSKTVSYKYSLSSVILEELLHYLQGCEKKMEIPPLEDLHLGIAALHKQLLFHPPCKPVMRRLYLKMCRDNWPLLLAKLEKVLRNRSSPTPEREDLGFMKVDLLIRLPEAQDTQDTLLDFKEVLQSKKEKKIQIFLNQSREEKLDRLTVLLKFFIEVFRVNTTVWFARNWCKKHSVHRSDISPILSEITWSRGNLANLGCLNQSIKQVFSLYCQSSSAPSLHSMLSVIISLYAMIIHRTEMSVLPEMGSLGRNFAQGLYQTMKLFPQLELNLGALHPDWLKFQVASFFLGVEEPANFYKAKEKIIHILLAKDNCFPLEFTFDVEVVCKHAITAMIGMFELQPLPLYSGSSEFLEDSELNLAWFEDTVEDSNIKLNLKTLSRLLTNSCIKERRGFYFDEPQINFNRVLT